MKRIILFILMLALVFTTACGSKTPETPVITDREKLLDKDIEISEVENIKWRDGDLLAIAFLGYNQYGDIFDYIESGQVEEFLYTIERPDDYETLELEGDEMYFIIPRYSNSKLLIRGADDADIEYYSGNAKPVLLQTNIGDIYPDTEILVRQGENEAKLAPILDGMDSSIVISDSNILDISLYLETSLGSGYEYEIEEFEGFWTAEYIAFGEAEKTVTLHFWEYVPPDGDSVYWYEIAYMDYDDGYEMLGRCFFEPPSEYWTPEDEEYQFLYLDFSGFNMGPNGEDYFDIFGKYSFEFLDHDTFIMTHLDYDPLCREDGIEYIFKRQR